MQYFFLGIVYGTVKWKSFGNDLIFADIWIYYGFSFDIAEIFRGDRRMAGHAGSGTAGGDDGGGAAVEVPQAVWVLRTCRLDKRPPMREYT